MSTVNSEVVKALVEFGGELRCPICRGLFSSPVALPCMHCVCKECCGNMWDAASNATVSRPTKIRCPQCRQEITSNKYVKSDEKMQEIVTLFVKACAAMNPDLDLGSQIPTLTQLVAKSNEDDDNDVPATPMEDDETPPPTANPPPITPTAPPQQPVIILSNNVVSTAKKDPFRLGATVTVARRKGPNINKPGGVGRITKRNEDDGTFDIHYTVEGNREKRVPIEFLTPGLDLENDSLFGSGKEPRTPERSNNTDSQKKRKQTKLAPPRVCFSGGFSTTQRRKFRDIITKLDGEMVEDEYIMDWSTITHLVIETQLEKEVYVAKRRSEKYLLALACGGIWIVTSDWLNECRRKNQWVNESQFEVAGDMVSLERNLPLGGPQRARKIRGEQQALFAGQAFAFSCCKTHGLDLATLTARCGGTVFEGNLASFFHFCAKCKLTPHIVVRDADDNDEMQQDDNDVLLQDAKFKAASQPVQWLLGCIATYTILEE